MEESSKKVERFLHTRDCEHKQHLDTAVRRHAIIYKTRLRALCNAIASLTL